MTPVPVSTPAVSVRVALTPVVTVQQAPVPKRVSTHSNLSEIVANFRSAPPVKETRQRGVQSWERNAWTNYHMDRMKTFAEKAKSPNLSLYESRNKRVERVILALYTYFVGIAFLFFLGM